MNISHTMCDLLVTALCLCVAKTAEYFCFEFDEVLNFFVIIIIFLPLSAILSRCHFYF